MYWRPRGLPSHHYDAYQWGPERAGLYESNYLKANSEDGRYGLWLKHNILSWKDRRRGAVVELWCVLFVRGEEVRVWKEELPVDAVRLGRDEVSMEGEGVLLSPGRTATRIRDGGREVSWDIALRPETEAEAPLVHFPYAGLYTWKLPKKKLLTPEPRQRWNGVLRFDGEELEIRDWVGFRNHNWGTEHAHTYAYGNCNLFRDAPGVVADGFSARLRVGLWKTPLLSALIVRDDVEDHAFNSVRTILTAQAHLAFPRWELKLQSRTHKVSWVQEAQAEDFVGLAYQHPDGKMSYCYNTKWAKTTVELEHCSGARKRWESDLGELEFLFTKPRGDVALYKHAG